jgi:hypothetical protein
MWRGGLGSAYLLPALSAAGASLSGPCSVSTSRSSNRTGLFQASGSRRKSHGVAQGRLAVLEVSRTSPNSPYRASSEYRFVPDPCRLCLAHNH